MIKLERVVLPSSEQMEFVIEGMRNPMNSWEKSDTCFGDVDCHVCAYYPEACDLEKYRRQRRIGPNDLLLMQKLSNAGTDHRKFMRMIPVMVRITAPLYWWKEFDTYKVGTVANSCSTMHKITAKEFDRGDFSHEHIPKGSDNYSDTWDISTTRRMFCINKEEGYYLSSEDILDFTIRALNHYREQYLETGDKIFWWQLIQLLPSSYNQTRNVMLNYEVLANIYPSRKNHKLDEWQEFCDWIESLPYHEIITGGAE